MSFPRSAARRLRMLARKCVAGRPRGPAPPVLLKHEADGTRLSVEVEDVTVALRIDNASVIESAVLLSMEALEAVEGAGEERVEIECHSKHVTLKWTDRGLPRSQNFVMPKPKAELASPPLPKSLSPISPSFLTALHQAAQSTARTASRYALQRVQIRGTAGEVIGTDSFFVYRHYGFKLPFADDILVPAVSLFGLEEWAKAEICIGRTLQHLVITAEDVTVWLRIDTAGRFPHVASVVPKAPKPATLTLDPAEALFLLDALPGLLRNDEQHHPVTLDYTAATGVVRAAAQGGNEVVEVRLPRSPVKSGRVRIAVDRRYLIRMLTLGCQTFLAFSDQRPILAIGPSITTLVMPVDFDLIVPPSSHARVLTPESPPQLSPSRSSPMKTPKLTTNGHDGEAFDPFVEADTLRSALGEAQTRLSRLLAALRSKKKQEKVLNQAWSSLKNLNLGG